MKVRIYRRPLDPLDKADMFVIVSPRSVMSDNYDRRGFEYRSVKINKNVLYALSECSLKTRNELAKTLFERK